MDIYKSKVKSLFHILLSYFIFFIELKNTFAQQENLISISIAQLNPKIKNNTYLLNNFKIIDLSVDDTESNGVDYQFGISSTSDSSYPFSATIKYNQLKQAFSDTVVYLFEL